MTNELTRRLDEIDKFDTYDNVRTGILAAISLTPVIGGAIGTLMSDYLPDWKFVRLKEFIRLLAADAERMSDELDEQKAKTTEFGLLLDHVMVETTKTTGACKREAYRAIVLNSCLPSESDQLEQEYFVSLVDRLQEIHFVVLSLFHDPAGFAHYHDVSIPKSGVYFDGKLKGCAKAIGPYLKKLSIADELVFGALNDLHVMCILTGFEEWNSATLTTHRDLSVHLNGFGRRFTKFILMPLTDGSAKQG